MPTVVKISHSLIADYIRSRNWRYLTDNDGDMVVNFKADDETGYEWSVYFILDGKEKEIYQMIVRASKRFPKAEWPRIVLLCNEWNKKKRWPRSYLDIPDNAAETEAHIILDMSIDLEQGIHRELFEDLTDTIFTCAIQFWKWAHLEHGL